MKKIYKDIIEFTTRFIENSKPLVIVLIIAVVIMGVANGYKYYNFTQNNPKFCELCHLMKESYISWQKSSHNDIDCQTCHSMSLISQNRLLLSYIFAGGKSAISQEHGREKPWKSCNICHIESVKQGAVTMRKSYGHARHVFMEKIECNKCHTSQMHNFLPDEKNCLTCHTDKGVHGMGMESFACLSCHVYAEVTAMPTKQKCLNCHKEIPQKGTMSGIDCQKCHKPHSKIKPSANDCLINCHTNQHDIGRHDRHSAISCLVCHQAHSWKVGRELARRLCIKCHEYKEPETFIF